MADQPTGARWHTFIGQWDDDANEPDDWTFDEATHETWREARQWMLGHLAKFADDECAACRQDGVQALVHLATSRERLWSAEIDGDDYLIRYARTANHG